MWSGIASSVASGVLVALILAVARLSWHRRRVPWALSRRVRRRSYLRAVLAASEWRGVRRLDVLAPRLMPARGREAITRIQSAWARISHDGEARVLCLDSDDCLEAGAELLESDVEVRVARRDLDSESLTFHLFEASDPARSQAIINHHDGDADKPSRISGAAPIQPFRSYFDRQWQDARPLESVLAERILGRLDARRDVEAVLGSLAQAREALKLGANSTRSVLPHLAFRDSSAVVFIVGQPGTGKSYVRRLLADRLRSMRIECDSVTDYPYAYLDLLRAVLLLSPQGRTGYRAYEGGAFIASDEAALAPALRATAGAVRDSVRIREVTLVEFARADLVTALEEFDCFRLRSQVIHVAAPASLRLERLSRRAVPPEASVTGEEITLSLSDNHLLPESAEHALYSVDGIASLKASGHWRDKIFEIDNGYDGASHVADSLDKFTEKIIHPYIPADMRQISYDQRLAS